MLAVKQHKKPLPLWLLLGGTVFLSLLVSLTPPVLSAVAAGTIKACLVQTIDTSQWSPPSPDSSGITLLPNGHLLISDSEVEECVNGQLPVYWQGVNLFEADRADTLLATSTTYTHPSGTCPTSPTGTASNFSSEPTGVTINPANGHLFFSDDDQHRIFEVNLGSDGKYGTADDVVTSFSATALNPSTPVDPEGVAFGRGNLFVADGVEGGASVYQIDPGPNGRFDGVPPAGDDVVVNHFATTDLGVTDPEGVAFNPDDGTLYIVGADRHMAEATITGTLLQQIDISALNACAPADVVVAPGSTNPGVKHLYIPDRGVDNNADPAENDGKVYEVALDPAECAQLPENLLLNAGFELDCNNNTVPDRWSGLPPADPRFTRSKAVVHSGQYAGKHSATDDSSYTISQTVTGLSAGTTYTFSGWVNIPPTSDTFTFGLEVKWLNASNVIISPQTIKTYTAAIGGWDEAVASLVAPAGTTSAQVQMVVSSLNATIYVDDFAFTAAGAARPPTITSFTPSSGPVGTVVTITGTNFTGATKVAFNGTAATTFTVDSNTQLHATVPSGASTGPISVTTPAGTGVSASNFTVTAPPPPPTANFSGSPTSGTAPLTVHFTDQSTGNPTSWAWDFQNDGTVDSTLQNPQFTYTTAGSYTVRLTVSNAAGSNTTTKVGYITVTAPPPPPSNLLLNPGFELDANNDGEPDSWSASSKFTRSNEVGHSGSYAGKFLVTDNSSSTVNQTVNNLTAGTTYSFSGWVNIPPTIGLSTFTLKMRWLNASEGLISAQTIKTYTALTLGWDQATASMVAPAGTTHAQMEMTVETLLLNLNTTVYVDDFVFKQ